MFVGENRLHWLYALFFFWVDNEVSVYFYLVEPSKPRHKIVITVVFTIPDWPLWLWAPVKAEKETDGGAEDSGDAKSHQLIGAFGKSKIRALTFILDKQGLSRATFLATCHDCRTTSEEQKYTRVMEFVETVNWKPTQAKLQPNASLNPASHSLPKYLF